MNRLLPAIIFIAAVAAGAMAAPSLIDHAEDLFKHRHYLEGITILTNAINDTDPVSRCATLGAYARFNENIVGDIDTAVQHYSEILRSSVPADHRFKLSARKEINRIDLLKIQYAAEDNAMKQIRMPETLSQDKLGEQITQLETMVAQKPGYYRLCEVYYNLGCDYYAHGQFYLAYITLRKAVELKPGINFHLSVNTFAEMAYSKWIRAVINSVTRTILTVLLALTAIAFYLSRPWQWLRPRHAAIFAALVIVWLVVFAVAHKLLCGSAVISAATIISLFTYGLIGVATLFVFSIGLATLKYRVTATMITMVFVLLLFVSLATSFYMRNCDQKNVFNAPRPITSPDPHCTRVVDCNRQKVCDE